MSATTSVKQGTGAASGGLPTTSTTVTNVRLCSADAASDGTAHPIQIPSSGINYSYEAWLYLNADTTPAGTINNVKWFTDGSIGFGTGVSLYAGTTATYAQATGTSGTTGNPSSTATTDAGTYTAASPLAVAGSITNPNTGKVSAFVVLQLRVTSAASPGTLPTETGTFRYDET